MTTLFETLRKPVMQAPIGSACSTELALAVANAGGIGSLALTWSSPEEAAETVRHMHENTRGIFTANYALSFEPVSLVAALDAGVPAVVLSWGMSERAIALINQSNAALGVQVGSLAAAQRALDAGADFLVCQGLEAGGHVQSTTALALLLRQVLELTDIPVIAAGGMATARDVANTIAAGATAAALGTRFVNALESRAHPAYQQAIMAAGCNDTAYTCCFDGGWPHSNSRVLRNATLDRWEAAGCPQPGSRPGENSIVATTESGWNVPLYHIASPVEKTTGDLLNMALYAGMGASRINDVLPAAQIVEQLCAELPETKTIKP